MRAEVRSRLKLRIKKAKKSQPLSQKSVEKELIDDEIMQISEARFRNLFKQSLLAVEIHAPDGRILYVNQAYTELWGLTQEEARGYNILKDTQLIEAGVMPYIEAGFRGEPTLLPITFYEPVEIAQRGQGRGRWVQSFVYPVKDSAGTIREVFITYQDVTEQKLAEQQLKEKEAQYRSIFEATSDGLIIVNASGVIVEVNPACCEMYGYSREEFIGLRTRDITHFASFDVLRGYMRALQLGQQYRTPAISLRKGGLPFHVEVFGTSFTYKGKPHALGVIRDMTEQVAAYNLLEQRVQERTRELTTLLEVSHNVASTLKLQPLLDLILDQLKIVADYRGASITRVESGQIVTLAARRPNLGQNIPSPTRFPSQPAKALIDEIQSGEPVIIDDIRGDSKLAKVYRQFAGGYLDTTFSYVRSWMAVPLILKGQMLGAIILAHDEPGFYTERQSSLVTAIANQAAVAIENARLYEQALTIAALEERQRLARELHDSVSQALFGISLSSNTAKLLLERNPARLPQTLDYIASLAQAGMAEMRALIFELRPESLEIEGLVAALTKQSDSLRARFNIAVETVFPLEPEVPIGIKEVLYRIGQESMHNIVKHANATKVWVNLTATEQSLVLEIKDNGVGFDANGTYPGHLGLRSMYERVDKVGGKLAVSSVPAQGTTVQVEIPLKIPAKTTN